MSTSITPTDLYGFMHDIRFAHVSSCRDFLAQHPEAASLSLDALGTTPLHMAMGSGLCTVELLDLLIDAGADIDAKSALGQTPLYAGANAQLGLAPFLHLIDRGADILGKEPNHPLQWSVLHNAVRNRRNEMARVLITKSKPEWIEDIGPDGERPLHAAVAGNNPEGCKLLIQAGANPALRGGRFNHLPIDMAVDANNTLHSHLKTIMTLIAMGADPLSVSAKSHWIPYSPELAEFAKNDDALMLELNRCRILQNRPISKRLMREITSDAVQRGRLDTVEFLIALESRPFFWSNYTPEMAAVASGDRDLLLLLHQKRKAQGQSFTSQEMEQLDAVARDQKQMNSFAFLQSLRAQDAIDSVCEKKHHGLVL